jgi:hypothetical protein
MPRFLSTAAALATVVSVVLVGGASAAPEQIVFSGTLEGISIDVGSAETGDTFRTTGGTFTATDGLKSGVYSSTFTLGTATELPGLIRSFAVTGTFTLDTNGGTFTAAVVPASSSVHHGLIPGDFFQRRFFLQLQVVSGTGRFKKMTGTIALTRVDNLCGWPFGEPPHPLCPDQAFPFDDPTRDWVTVREGTLSGTLMRES